MNIPQLTQVHIPVSHPIYIKFSPLKTPSSERNSTIAIYRYMFKHTPSQQQLRILMLSDGIAGHENQSRGLINWLSSRYNVEVETIDIRLKLKFVSRTILPIILHHSNNNRLVNSFYKYSASKQKNFNLIISMGGNTSFLNVALARQLSITNIFIGSKRHLSSGDFSAHLTLLPTREEHNVVMKMSPSLTEPTRLAQQGKFLRAQLQCKASDKVYLIAIGGDGAGYRYDKKSCEQLAQLMIKISKNENCKWLLTTSRRTGVKIEQALQALIPSHLLLDSVWWGSSPRKVMDAYLGLANRIFISIDSMSMLSEAIASGKPTLLLQPDSAAPSKRYQQTLKRYCQAKYCAIHQLSDALIPPFYSSSTPLQVAREDLLDQLSPLLKNIANQAHVTTRHPDIHLLT